MRVQSQKLLTPPCHGFLKKMDGVDTRALIPT
jgi:hypothetical protein